MKVKEKLRSPGEMDGQPFAVLFGMLPVIVAGAACIVYFLFTTDQLGGADSGELIGTSFNWGVAHPPGYPLYVSLAKLFSLVSPFENIVYTYNLFSTLCFLVSLAVLHRGLRSIDVHPAAIAVGGSFFIFSAINLRWLTTAEVFALHLLICSLGISLTFATIRAERLVPASRWLGLVAGLGAANHHTIVFLFPGFFYVYGLYWWKLGDNRARSRELGWLSLTFMLGFSFYLQPVLSSRLHENPVSCLGISIRSFQDFIDFFLRRMYGTFSLASSSNEALPPFFWLRRYIATGIFSGAGLTFFTGVPAACQLVLALFSWNKIANRACLLWVLVSLSFFLLVDVDPWVEQNILGRMYLMPNLAVTLAAILALDFFIKKAQAARAQRATAFVMLAASTVLLAVAIWNGSKRIDFNPVDVELRFGRDILANLQPDSLLFVNSDTDVFSTFYLQEVEGFRKDVVPVIGPMTGRGHYRNYLASRLGRKVGLRREPAGSGGHPARSTGENSSEVSTAEWILALLKRGTAVYSMEGVGSLLADESDPAKDLLVATPAGIVWRLTIAGEHALTREEILQENLLFMESCLQWMPVVDFTRLQTTETNVLERYLEHLKLLRNYQFSIERQAVPSAVLEKLCLLIQQKDAGDQLADFYLGLYYYRFGKDLSLAAGHMSDFLKTYTGESRETLDIARLVLRKAAGGQADSGAGAQK